MDLEQATNNCYANMAAMEAWNPTTQQVSDALTACAPAMQAAWDQCMRDDTLWAARAKKRGILSTWLLRWQLNCTQKSDS